MKFIKFFALASVLAFASNAAAEETNYAPEANDFSLEVSINPFSNDFSTFKLDQIKARIFFTDKDALRIGLGFGINSHKETPNPEKNDSWSKEKERNFSLNLGYERNVYSYKRINLYAGAGICYDWEKSDSTSYTLREPKTYGKSVSYNGKWGFYAKAFTGIDFYVYKGLYIGAELYLRIGVNNNFRPYTKGGIVESSGTWSDNYESEKGPKSSDFVLGLGAEPALRLGWSF